MLEEAVDGRVALGLGFEGFEDVHFFGIGEKLYRLFLLFISIYLDPSFYPNYETLERIFMYSSDTRPNKAYFSMVLIKKIY